MVDLGGWVARRMGSDISWTSSGPSALCRGVFRGLGRRTGSAISMMPLGAVLILVMPNARPFSAPVHSELSTRAKGRCGESSGSSLSTGSITPPLVEFSLPTNS